MIRHLRILPSVAAAAILGLLLAACWVPVEQGRAMEGDLVRLKDDLARQKRDLEVLEQRSRREQDVLREKQEALLAEVAATLETLNRVAHKTGADLGVELEATQQDVARLRGLFEETQVRFAALEDALAALREETESRAAAKAAPVEATPRPTDKQAFYDLARARLDEGEHREARELFTEFLGRWKSDPLAANAQYWLGETWYAQKRYREAIFEFQKVQESYPKSDKAPDALLKIGFSFAALGLTREAVPFLEEVVSAHPKAGAARLAREKLRELKGR